MQFKISRNHIERKKKQVKVNFKTIFYLNQYIQNSIISACNQYKNYSLGISFSHTNFWNSLCTFHLQLTLTEASHISCVGVAMVSHGANWVAENAFGFRHPPAWIPKSTPYLVYPHLSFFLCKRDENSSYLRVCKSISTVSVSPFHMASDIWHY